MPNTVPTDAEYRSNGCRIPFQRIRYPQAKTVKTVINQWLARVPVFF